MERTSSVRRRPQPSAQAAETGTKHKPKRAKKSSGVTSKLLSDGVHVSAAVGARPYMEDAYAIHTTEKALVVGVFDGHGGDHCSQFCASRFCVEIAGHGTLSTDSRRALTEVFTKLDKEYCETDGSKGAGSTATVAVLQQADEEKSKFRLSVGFVGDSSAVLIRSDNSFEMLTSNHHGSRRDEKKRIEKLGGKVIYDGIDDLYRVAGVLAVTRAIGDVDLKPYVTGTPEVKEATVSENDLLVLGSDGLWDVFEPEDLINELRRHGVKAGIKAVVSKAAKEGDDNVCAIAVDIKEALENHFSHGNAASTAAAGIESASS